MQRAKEVVSDYMRLEEFAIALVNSVLSFPNGQVKFFGEFKLQKSNLSNIVILVWASTCQLQPA